METRLRLALISAGLPEPEVQYEVCNRRNYVVARVDLAYPEAKLAIEYDGAVHDDPLIHERDRQRDNDLADLGWDVMHLRKHDVLYDMADTARRIGFRVVQRGGAESGVAMSDTLG